MAIRGEEGRERSPAQFHFFFASFVLSQELLKKITATVTSSREADMLSRFFVRNFLPSQIHFLPEMCSTDLEFLRGAKKNQEPEKTYSPQYYG